MKIASIECLPVHSGWRKNFVFVRVGTDAGIVGWGEAYSQYDRDTAIAAQVNELGRYLTGRDPFQIRHILGMAFDDYAQRRGSLEFYCAVSGVEQALWDIVGKETNQPVYNLLGGPVRSRIRVYANGWSYKVSDPDEFAKRAADVVERGFTALKFDPVPGPWRTYIPKDHIRHAVKVLKAVRKAIGAEIDILIEVHRRLAPMHAIDLANAIAEFDLYWLEEPCLATNVEAIADVRRNGKIPIVTGEALYTRAEFRPFFRARAVDIINPDVSNCGGILELLNIAAAAESEQIAVSPHNYNSTSLALSATAHASACMQNFIITEYFLPLEDISAKLAPNALKPVNGYLPLPEGPGLGLDVDENAVREAKGKQFPARTMRLPQDEGP
jgi:galactonate dehydratase